ncbi:MAG: L-aspartate oxidase [Finegoldia sp.]|nr:L-aspartate oxidase [Finegoldia sp.]
MEEVYDSLVIGSGVAGLITALEISPDKKVLLVTKKNLEDSNSYLAQGGICVLKSEEDRQSFIEDTMKAGHYENDPKAVEILVDESGAAIETLIGYSVPFNKEGGDLALTKEGGHSTNRIAFCQDRTGKFIMDSLIKEIRKRKNIEIREGCSCKNLLIKDGQAYGALLDDKDEYLVYAETTVLATGGLGGLFKNTTNFRHICGDGIAMAIENDIDLRDISYIQIHPTAFYDSQAERKFLISESVRGEGAVLLNHDHKRFTDELKPRDIVTKAILSEMEREKVDHEFLDFSPIKIDIDVRFPNIVSHIQEKNIDPHTEPVPIVPAYHYTMGGIRVDYQGHTSIKNLYAVGEVSSTGVHGKNRLASNSLLEAVVYGKRVAADISLKRDKKIVKVKSYAIDFFKAKVRILERIEKDEKDKTERISNKR